MRNIPTSKTLWEKASEGWTEKDFSTYYGCSLEELIGKAFKKDKNNAQKITRKISANGKRKGKKSSKANLNTQRSELAVDKTNDIALDVTSESFNFKHNEPNSDIVGAIEQCNSTETAKHPETAKKESLPTTKSVEELKVEIDSLRAEKITLESERKKQLSRRRMLCGVLEKMSSNLAEIEKQLTSELDKFVEISGELSMIPQELQKNKSSISEIDEELSSLQEKLRSLTIVKLYCGSNDVHDSGYNINEMEIQNNQISSKVSAMLTDSFEEFTKLNLDFSKITELARILIAVEMVVEENPGKKIELLVPNGLTELVKNHLGAVTDTIDVVSE